MTRALLLPALTLAIAALAGASGAQRDNVLVVLADDLGVDSVGVYGEGAAPPPTPYIDALAARGVLFRNAWSNPICSPTRACLQTGRYASRTGVGHVIWYQPPVLSRPQNVLQLAEVTLPELLDAQVSGYAHAFIGKWHLGDETNGARSGPNLAGYSHFAGFIKGSANFFEWNRTVNGVTTISNVYTSTKMVDDALAWIRTAPEPWIVQLAFNAPHPPYHVPPSRLRTQSVSPRSPIPALYKAAVEAMDTEMGRLFEELGPALSRTNVVFMGDNGTPREASEPPFLPTHAKGTPYEGGVNVPLIVAGPAVTAPGREDAALVSAVDVFATMVDLCGVSVSAAAPPIDGVSFVPHLRDPRHPPVRATVFAESFGGPTPFGYSGVAAIRNAKYKLVRQDASGATVDELYDLSTDPFEVNDLLLGTLSTQEQAAHVALDNGFGAIRVNIGSFVNYGARQCPGSNGAPELHCAGIPSTGSSYEILLRNGPIAQPAALFVGLSATSGPGGTPLPLPLAPIGGGPNCFIYSSYEAMLWVQTGSQGEASIPIPVPTKPALVSTELYHCWLGYDPTGSYPLLFTASDGGAVVLGS